MSTVLTTLAEDEEKQLDITTTVQSTMIHKHPPLTILSSIQAKILKRQPTVSKKLPMHSPTLALKPHILLSQKDSIQSKSDALRMTQCIKHYTGQDVLLKTAELILTRDMNLSDLEDLVIADTVASMATMKKTAPQS